MTNAGHADAVPELRRLRRRLSRDLVPAHRRRRPPTPELRPRRRARVPRVVLESPATLIVWSYGGDGGGGAGAGSRARPRRRPGGAGPAGPARQRSPTRTACSRSSRRTAAWRAWICRRVRRGGGADRGAGRSAVGVSLGGGRRAGGRRLAGCCACASSVPRTGPCWRTRSRSGCRRRLARTRAGSAKGCTLGAGNTVVHLSAWVPRPQRGAARDPRAGRLPHPLEDGVLHRRRAGCAHRSAARRRRVWSSSIRRAARWTPGPDDPGRSAGADRCRRCRRRGGPRAGRCTGAGAGSEAGGPTGRARSGSAKAGVAGFFSYESATRRLVLNRFRAARAAAVRRDRGRRRMGAPGLDGRAASSSCRKATPAWRRSRSTTCCARASRPDCRTSSRDSARRSRSSARRSTTRPRVRAAARTEGRPRFRAGWCASTGRRKDPLDPPCPGRAFCRAAACPARGPGRPR